MSARQLVAIVSILLVTVTVTLTTGEVQAQEPTTVTVAGSLQSELGCAGDWQPDCAATGLTFDAGDGVWQGIWNISAGAWEYKAALNGSWDENYGQNATANGASIPLSLAGPAPVKFYYSHATHWVTDAVSSRIVTAPGSFQSELGCAGDWQPDCLRAWLQDPDGDGIFTFQTTVLPVGSYETKATIGESWDENYGAGGVLHGANVPFVVSGPGNTIVFSFVSATNILTVTEIVVPVALQSFIVE